MPGQERVEVEIAPIGGRPAACDRRADGDEQRPLDAAAIRAWLVDEVAALVRTVPDEIDPLQPFMQYGIGSAQALELAAKLEDWIGLPLSPTLIWDYPNIDSLARHLAETPDCAPTAERQDDR